ncbi:hypothetical protein NPIL_367661, partial [Nephila pilipes]
MVKYKFNSVYNVSVERKIFSNNAITELSDTAFRKNPKLTLLEMGGNPITKVGGSTFAHLPNLKKL